MGLDANVKDLYEAGRVFLPQAAEKYGQAASGIHETARSQDAAFERDVVSDNEGTKGPYWTDDPRNAGRDQFSADVDLGQMQPQWTALRNLLQDQILVRTCNSLQSAGQALVKISEHYAATDAEASRTLEERRQELDNTSDETYRTPDDIPAPPTSDDPLPDN